MLLKPRVCCTNPGSSYIWVILEDCCEIACVVAVPPTIYNHISTSEPFKFQDYKMLSHLGRCWESSLQVFLANQSAWNIEVSLMCLGSTWLRHMEAMTNNFQWFISFRLPIPIFRSHQVSVPFVYSYINWAVYILIDPSLCCLLKLWTHSQPRWLPRNVTFFQHGEVDWWGRQGAVLPGVAKGGVNDGRFIKKNLAFLILTAI